MFCTCWGRRERSRWSCCGSVIADVVAVTWSLEVMVWDDGRETSHVMLYTFHCIVLLQLIGGLKHSSFRRKDIRLAAALRHRELGSKQDMTAFDRGSRTQADTSIMFRTS